MRDRERQLWTEFIERRECEQRRKKTKRVRPKDEPSPAELEAALDDLIKGGCREPKRSRRSGSGC
jgi:hypothetical protein